VKECCDKIKPDDDKPDDDKKNRKKSDKESDKKVSLDELWALKKELENLKEEVSGTIADLEENLPEETDEEPNTVPENGGEIPDQKTDTDTGTAAEGKNIDRFKKSIRAHREETTQSCSLDSED